MWLWAFVDQGRAVDVGPFLLWGILVTALGIASGLVFDFGIASCGAIDRLQRVEWRRLRIQMVLAASVASLVVAVNLVIDPSVGAVRGICLTIIAIIGGVPAGIALLGVRAAAATGASAERSRRLNTYRELRSRSIQLLNALGTLVALTTFALGASILANAARQGIASIQVILVFGGFGTTLVAAVYQIPRSALREEGTRLAAELSPLAAPDVAGLRQELEERDRVERLLGLQTDLMSDLQSGIVIFSPLLAAATAVLIRGG